ncbi:hypothetical protein FGO68_gene10216 [Halteria grandinella]|uniref:Uncharacterized protein n=1 Tax=Halteria grandinella TaxID=5974 RepID=A0A8J8NJC6_HALGN|nr:hypothetical protein FGO68_gene10216 [Halteria grandinella]
MTLAKNTAHVSGNTFLNSNEQLSNEVPIHHSISEQPPLASHQFAHAVDSSDSKDPTPITLASSANGGLIIVYVIVGFIFICGGLALIRYCHMESKNAQKRKKKQKQSYYYQQPVLSDFQQPATVPLLQVQPTPDTMPAYPILPQPDCRDADRPPPQPIKAQYKRKGVGMRQQASAAHDPSDWQQCCTVLCVCCCEVAAEAASQS